MRERDPVALGLPHREPFIFVDEVRERVAGESAECGKVFEGSEGFFAGHFPGDPVVPGVILTEAMAQTAGLAVGEAGRRFLLSGIRGMKFFRAVRPREALIFRAKKRMEMGGLWQFEVGAWVGEEVVAEGVVVLSEVSGGGAESGGG